MTIPVYLFLGFLEGGKTQFIQESMSDKRFHDGDRTLIVVCEEGIEEFDTSKFHGGNVTIAVIDDEAELNAKHLEELRKKCRAERVLIEYNGMWLIQQLAEALPKNWQIYQTMMMLDATTFDIYNANMRQLMIDKFSAAEMIAINRCEPGVDKAKFHNAVRALNRRASIVLNIKMVLSSQTTSKTNYHLTLKHLLLRLRTRISVYFILTLWTSLISMMVRLSAIRALSQNPLSFLKIPLSQGASV